MSRKILKKNFCVIPWSGFMLQPNGDIKNCVISNDVIGNIHKQNIEDILQNNHNIRKEMIDGEFPSSCNGCYMQEEGRKLNFNDISSRLYYAKNLGPKINPDVLQDKSKFDLKHVDLRWNNRCNQACVYCGPHNSTMWQKELGIKEKFEKSNIEKLKKYVFDRVEQLENVYLAGGEPMLINENKEFLELLYKKNKNVQIRINTNLSSTKTGVFELANKFKNVHWTISIEAIKEQYEYIRYGGKWKEFETNLDFILNNKDHKVSFNMLFFILNYNHVFDCVEYLLKKGVHYNSFVIGPVFKPLWTNVLNLPNKVLDKIKSNLKSKINENANFLYQNSLENILNYLNKNEFHANIKLTIENLKILDQRRKMDSTLIFKDLYKDIQE